MIGRPVNPPIVDSPLAWGTVGWLEDAGTSYYDLGDSSGQGSETALTLVRVTLFRGRDASQAIDQTRAQGQRILCQLSSNLFCVPPLGTTVIVANPGANRKLGGNATILFAVDVRGSQVYGGSYQAGDVSLAALLGFAQLLLQGDGTATLGARQGNASDGTAVTITAKPDGSVTITAQSVGLAGTDDPIALAPKIDSLINILTSLSAAGPSEPGYGALVTAMATYKTLNWTTNPTVGSSKVRAGR